MVFGLFLYRSLSTVRSGLIGQTKVCAHFIILFILATSVAWFLAVNAWMMASRRMPTSLFRLTWYSYLFCLSPPSLRIRLVRSSLTMSMVEAKMVVQLSCLKAFFCLVGEVFQLEAVLQQVVGILCRPPLEVDAPEISTLVLGIVDNQDVNVKEFFLFVLQRCIR